MRNFSKKKLKKIGSTKLPKKTTVATIATVVLAKWCNLLKYKQFKQAKVLCDSIMASCKKELLNKNGQSVYTDSRDHILVYGIFFHGLRDFTNLTHVILKATSTKEPTTKEQWDYQHKLVEEGWNHLCDSKERLQFVSQHLSNERLKWVLSQIQNFENRINHQIKLLGVETYYMSSDVYVKKEECTVCNMDPRSCSHEIGTIYNGVLCGSRILEREIKGASMVKVPKDYRCRIWPWRVDEEGRAGVCIMTLFKLDGFLDD